MPTVKHVVIAAAGLGSRLGMGKPKCLVEVQGRPIIEHLLALLKDIEDVRIVVGFGENDVMKTVSGIRSDIIFVRNPNFHATKTLDSYAMGAQHIKGDVLYMDADIIFDPASFQNFLNAYTPGQHLIGITDSKTEDAVFVKKDDEDNILSFSRNEPSDFEWANILFAPGNYFWGKTSGDVYAQLEQDLPLKSSYIKSFEVDRISDLENARKFVSSLK